MAWYDSVYSHYWQGFKWRYNNLYGHSGIDLGMPEGTPLTTPLDGLVIGAGMYPWGGQVSIAYNGSRVAGYTGPFVASYLHNRLNVVRVGQTVRAGTIIAYSGHPPIARYGSGSHCHYEIETGDKAPYLHTGLPYTNLDKGGAGHPIDGTAFVKAIVAGRGVLTGAAAPAPTGSGSGTPLSTAPKAGLWTPLYLYMASAGYVQRVINQPAGMDGIAEALDGAEQFAAWNWSNPTGSVLADAPALLVRGLFVAAGLFLASRAAWTLLEPAVSGGLELGGQALAAGGILAAPETGGASLVASGVGEAAAAGGRGLAKRQKAPKAKVPS